MENLFDNYSLIDLTHPISSEIPTWDGSCGFTCANITDYNEGLCVQKICLNAGIGTHMDAPSHFISGGQSIGDIPLRNFFLPLVKLDLSTTATEHTLISAEEILADEKTHGPIPKNCLYVISTGWEMRWDTPSLYRNADKNGKMLFPALSKQATSLLLERNIAGIAIDTLSPDCGDLSFPVHRLLLSSGKFIVENLANGLLLPPRGSFGIILPLFMPLVTESPVRAVALIKK